jgi:hypothetical protein
VWICLGRESCPLPALGPYRWPAEAFICCRAIGPCHLSCRSTSASASSMNRHLTTTFQLAWKMPTPQDSAFWASSRIPPRPYARRGNRVPSDVQIAREHRVVGRAVNASRAASNYPTNHQTCRAETR